MVQKVALNIIKDLILTITLILVLSIFVYKYWPENTNITKIGKLIMEALPLKKISNNRYELNFNRSSVSRIYNYSKMDKFSGIEDSVFNYFYKIYVSAFITQLINNNFSEIDSFKIGDLQPAEISRNDLMHKITNYIIRNSFSIDFDSLIFNVYVKNGEWKNILDVIQEFDVVLTQDEIDTLISYLENIDTGVKEKILKHIQYRTQKPNFQIVWNQTVGNLGVLWRYILYSLILLILAIIIPYQLVKFTLINSFPRFLIYLLFFPPFFISVIVMELLGIGYIPSLITAIIGNGLTFVLYQYATSIYDREIQAPYILALKKRTLKKKLISRALDFQLSSIILKRISSLLDTLIIIGVIVGRGDTPLITKVLFSMSRSNNIESMIWMLTFIFSVNLIMFFLRAITSIWTEGIREEVF